MKASDLMIGDYGITEGNDGENYVVKVVAVYNNDSINFDGVGMSGISDSINPIPLTPEVLEKSDFVKYIAGQYVLPKMVGEILVSIMPMKGLPNINGKWLVAIKNSYTDAKIAITYVHELQHVLKLCKIEKEIVL